MLADAGLLIQRASGVVAEPRLVEPGRSRPARGNRRRRPGRLRALRALGLGGPGRDAARAGAVGRLSRPLRAPRPEAERALAAGGPDALSLVDDLSRPVIAPGLPAAGRAIAGYTIEGVLGRGGMAVVYRATHPARGEPVALKLVAPHVRWTDAVHERFAREARLAAAVAHRGILPVYETRQARGPAVRRDEARAQRSRAPAARGAPAHAGASRGAGVAGRRGPRCRACARPCSSRHEALERAARRGGRRGAGVRRRLRRGASGLLRCRPANGRAGRHDRVRVARATTRRAGRPPHGRLLPRLPALRVPDRQAPVRAQGLARDRLGAPPGRASRAERAGSRPPARARRRRAPRPREAAGVAVRLGRRAGGHGAGRRRQPVASAPASEPRALGVFRRAP